MRRPPLRVLGLLPYPLERAPSQRYRVEQLVPALGALGVEVRLVPFVSAAEYDDLYAGSLATRAKILVDALRRRAHEVRRAREFDVIWVHREAALLGPGVIESAVASRRPLVFDFDDAIWLRSANPSSALATLLKFPGKARSVVARAAAVIAGNEYLARWASRINTNTHVVPTTIDTAVAYAACRRHAPADVPVIGWTGSATTFSYLAALRPMLADLASRRRFRLRVIGAARPADWGELDTEWLPWSGASEADDCLGMDIGLAPQPDTEWVRGKCGFKALQYMALGIPTVASRTGVLPTMISDGDNGLLASTPDEWLRALERLIDDWTLRERIGMAGRALVRERYSTSGHAPVVARILGDAAVRA